MRLVGNWNTYLARDGGSRKPCRRHIRCEMHGRRLRVDRTNTRKRSQSKHHVEATSRPFLGLAASAVSHSPRGAVAGLNPNGEVHMVRTTRNCASPLIMRA